MMPAVPPRSRVLAFAVALVALLAAPAGAQELQRGVIIDEVKCAADPAQSYAIYLPSTYSRDRQWPVLMAFHPAARGRAMVEKYQAAAEQYGYIVAGSNNSRNGPWSVSTAAAQAMWSDLIRRVSIDSQRLYLTGMSGGASGHADRAGQEQHRRGDRLECRLPG
jgi:poly(3-hydroxybutyrate) depolymerase